MASSPNSSNVSSPDLECGLCYEPYSVEGANDPVLGVPVDDKIRDCLHFVCMSCFSDMKIKKCPFDNTPWRAEPIKHCSISQLAIRCMQKDNQISELEQKNMKLAESLLENEKSISERIKQVESICETNTRDLIHQLEVLQQESLLLMDSKKELEKEYHLLLAERADLLSNSQRKLEAPEPQTSSVTGPSCSSQSSNDTQSTPTQKAKNLINGSTTLDHFGLTSADINYLFYNDKALFKKLIKRIHWNIMSYHTNSFDVPNKYNRKSPTREQYENLISLVATCAISSHDFEKERILVGFRGLYWMSNFTMEYYDEKVFKYFEQASAKNDPLFKYKLGCCYLYGIGTEKNYTLAKECFESAASNNFCRAQAELGRLHLYLLDQKDPDLGLYYLQLAVEQGDVIAMTEYGRWLSKTDKTVEEAVGYLSKAEYYYNHIDDIFSMGSGLGRYF